MVLSFNSDVYWFFKNIDFFIYLIYNKKLLKVVLNSLFIPGGGSAGKRRSSFSNIGRFEFDDLPRLHCCFEKKSINFEVCFEWYNEL